MKNNKERFINIQLFADEPTGATTPEISTQDGGVNYEQEYKRLQLELEKQKKLKDEYAKESAGYKKQLADRMTDDEKNVQAQKEFEEKMAQLESENKTYKLEKGLLSEGFTADECNKLISNNFEGKVIMEIIKARIEDNTKSIKAGLIKATTPADPVGNGTTSDPKGKKSGFALFQQEREEQSKNGKVEL